MNEAFGPYTSRKLYPMQKPKHPSKPIPHEWVIYFMVVVALGIAFATR